MPSMFGIISVQYFYAQFVSSWSDEAEQCFESENNGEQSFEVCQQ